MVDEVIPGVAPQAFVPVPIARIAGVLRETRGSGERFGLYPEILVVVADRAVRREAVAQSAVRIVPGAFDGAIEQLLRRYREPRRCVAAALQMTLQRQQMSAWYVFTALGFYPVAPGSNEYVIGRAFLRRAALTLPNGKVFTVRADALDDAQPYVGKVTLNGKPLARSVITHEQILAGGELRFTMQAKPDTRWGTRTSERPYSMSR